MRLTSGPHLMTHAAAWPLAVLLLLLAGCGSDRSAQNDSRPPVQAARQTSPQWVPIAVFSGSANADRTVEVPRDALQWRTRWHCRSGELTLGVTPAPRSGSARVDEPCPSVGKAAWAGTGRQQLGVRASDSWRVVVEAYSSARSGAAPSP